MKPVTSIDIQSPRKSFGCPTFPLGDSTFPLDQLLSDIELFHLVDLLNTKQLDMYFPKQDGRGFNSPGFSVTGCCKDFRVVFQAIRSWRKLSSERQQELKSRYESKSSNVLKHCIENTKYLSMEENKAFLISTALAQDPGCPSPLPHNAEMLDLSAAYQSSTTSNNESNPVTVDCSVLSKFSLVQGRGIANTIADVSMTSSITPSKKQTSMNNDSETSMITKAVIDKMLLFMKYQALYNDSIKHSNEFELKHSVISLTTRTLPYSNIHGGKSTRTKFNSPKFCATGSNKVEIVSSMLLFLSNAINELSPTEHTQLIKFIDENNIRKVSRLLNDLIEGKGEYSNSYHFHDTIDNTKRKSPIHWIVANGGLLKDSVEKFKVNLLENRSKKLSSSDQLHTETDSTKIEKKRTSEYNQLVEVVNKKPKVVPSFQEYAATVND